MMPMAAVADNAQVDFHPADHFEGARPGYLFRNGEKGFGYYRSKADAIRSLIVALRNHDLETARNLTRQDPELWHTLDEEGDSMLHWAALSGNAEMICAALDAGVSANVRSMNGQTPLMWACSKGSVSAVRALLSGKADIHLVDSKGADASAVAVQHKYGIFLLLFFAVGDKARIIASRDENGCGLAHWAAYVGDLLALKLLKHHEADLNVSDSMGKTPLHRAVSNCQSKEILKFLLDEGVSPVCKDLDGNTAMDIAHTKNACAMKKITEVLENRGLETNTEGEDLEASRSHPNTSRAKKAQQKNSTDLQKALMYGPAVFWMISVSITTVAYLVELRHISWTVAPRCCICFELGVPFSLALFIYVATLSPGTLPTRPQKFAIEEVTKSLLAGEYDKVPALCVSSWVVQGPRMKYCKEIDAVVHEFDHFCGWLNTPIGRDNHRWFIALTFVELGTQIAFFVLCWSSLKVLVPRAAEDTFRKWFATALGSYTLLTVVLLLHSATGIFVLGLFVFHMQLICQNYTTNDNINAKKYGYTVKYGYPGMMKVSPWDKGGWFMNCLDFWWWRRRTEQIEGARRMANCD